MTDGSYEPENCLPHFLFELGIDICRYSAFLMPEDKRASGFISLM